MMRHWVEQLTLFARTTRNLRLSQVFHRARLRVQRFPPDRPLASSVISLIPSKSRPPVGWPAAFTPLDLQLSEGCPTPEDNAEGRFEVLDEGRDLGRPASWDPRGVSRLWKYHLHYMEWAWSFSSHPNRSWARQTFAELWRSWDDAAPFGRGDEWSPYTASLRAWVLCGTYGSLVFGSDVQRQVEASLDRHARFLRFHLEHDVGGNHLVKNLKALIGLGVFLGEESLSKMASRELERQLSIQVLSDGGHYERSPSYHCQILGDFIDIAALLASAGRPAVPGLNRAIDAMRNWLGLILMPDGDVPLFNDCELVGLHRLSLLRPGAPPTNRLTVLAASGYVVMRPDDRLHLVADVGDPCPPDLPAHAHADCLSFELSVDGKRFVVDSGTSTYEPGEQRRHERSTAAHNTVSVDGADQSEVWGTFRVARMARGRLEQAEDDGDAITVTASHDGYRRLPGSPVHRRRWDVLPSQVRITDQVVGEGEHRIESRLHLAGNDVGKVVWCGPADMRVDQSPTRYATRFGYLHDGHTVSAEWRGLLPVTIGTELHFDNVLLQPCEASNENAGQMNDTT